MDKILNNFLQAVNEEKDQRDSTDPIMAILTKLLQKVKDQAKMTDY